LTTPITAVPDFGPPTTLDQVAHIVAQRGQIDNRLAGVLPQRGFVIRYALGRGEGPWFACIRSHGFIVTRIIDDDATNRPIRPMKQRSVFPPPPAPYYSCR
jgi:hypothetical protein